jgi:hypothetical protein
MVLSVKSSADHVSPRSSDARMPVKIAVIRNGRYRASGPMQPAGRGTELTQQLLALARKQSLRLFRAKSTSID